MTGLALLFLTAFVLIALIGSGVIIWRIVRPRRKTLAVALGQNLPTDPADVALPASEATFNLPGSHTTPGWVITGRQPAGPTVLILHGHGDARYGALRFAEQLAQYAAHIVVFDWPGHGECTAPWMTCGTREPDDALAVLEGLPDAVSGRPVVLFGYSLGGQIAIKTAGLNPERFVGVVADGPYRHWDSPVRKRLQHHGLPMFPFMPLTGLFFHFIGLIKQFDRAVYARQIACPLLVLHGTADRLCPIEEGQELAEAAPHGTFAPIEGGQHNRLFTHDPDEYHAAVGRFFELVAERVDTPGRRESA